MNERNGRNGARLAGTYPRHPAFSILLEDEGRSYVWLARQTGLSHAHIKAMAAGIRRVTPRVRRQIAVAMNRPEHELFPPDAVSPDESAA